MVRLVETGECDAYNTQRSRRAVYLAMGHVRARLEFARRHAEWTVEDWKRVIWSDDETKIIGREEMDLEGEAGGRAEFAGCRGDRETRRRQHHGLGLYVGRW